MLRTTTTTNNKKQSKKFLSFCLSCFFSLFFLNFQCSILSDNVDDDKRPEDKPSTDRSIVDIDIDDQLGRVPRTGVHAPPLTPPVRTPFFFLPPTPVLQRPPAATRLRSQPLLETQAKPGKTR